MNVYLVNYQFTPAILPSLRVVCSCLEAIDLAGFAFDVPLVGDCIGYMVVICIETQTTVGATV